MSNYKVEYLGDENTLFLDLSSECSGWVVANMNRATKEVTVSKAGVLWFDKTWEHGQKYNHVCKFLLDIAYPRLQVEHCVAEAYMFNKNRAIGVAVIPEMTGSLKSSCYEVTPALDFHTLLPQSWRATLGIKKDTTKTGTGMWKIPTKKRIEELLNFKFPDTVQDQLKGKQRKTPFDLVDAFGVCLGWFMADPNNCTKITISPNAFL